MTKPAGQDANASHVPPATAPGEDLFGFSPWLKQMPGVPLHPLMAHPMAAMAATTAIGLGIAGQMAGMMLGMMQTAAERATGPASDIVPVAETKIEVARESATPKTAQAKPARRMPAAKAAKADDLKAISGIGPKLEQVLNGMGLRRYADIVALKAADVARIEAELGFSGRIARDGWVEQARTLVKGRG